LVCAGKTECRLTTRCPVGKVILGGGITTRISYDAVTNYSGPIKDGAQEGWQAGIVNRGSGNAKITVTAICVYHTPYGPIG